MEIAAGTISRIKNNKGVVYENPRFIVKTHCWDDDSAVMKIPQNFVQNVGKKLPTNIIFQFPNGREVHLHYRRTLGGFTDLDPLYMELGGESGFYLLLTYIGEGIFSLAVIDEEHTEIEYGINKRIARAPVTIQDKLGGKRWKFLTYAIGPIFLNGSVQIPPGFKKRFESIIPSSVRVCLRNGDEMQCTYYREDARIYGLLPLVQNNFVETSDIMIFTYRGKGKFELGIFDKAKVEKSLAYEVIDIDSDSGGEEEDEDHGQSGDQLQYQLTNDAADIDMVDVEFTKVLNWSNTNSSTHGVNIPLRVKPNDRNWVAGEKVKLQTLKGVWTVGIVVTIFKRVECIL